MARILEDEIAGDPLGRGYSGMNDVQLLASLNAKTINRNLDSMTGREVKRQIIAAEYTALSDAEKQRLLEWLRREDLDLFGLDRDILVDVFGSSSVTVRNLDVARTVLVSRGLEIGWGVVTEKDLRMHTLGRKERRT